MSELNFDFLSSIISISSIKCLKMCFYHTLLESRLILFVVTLLQTHGLAEYIAQVLSNFI